VGGGLVALLDDVLVLDDGVVLVGVDDEVVVGGVVVEEVLDEVEDEVLDELELELDVVELQSWAASALMVPAPWPRFCTRVGLTDCGSFATELLSAAAALCA
jgi:hypothetical protein